MLYLRRALSSLWAGVGGNAVYDVSAKPAFILRDGIGIGKVLASVRANVIEKIRQQYIGVVKLSVLIGKHSRVKGSDSSFEGHGLLWPGASEEAMGQRYQNAN